jgi:hypothetical protein
VREQLLKHQRNVPGGRAVLSYGCLGGLPMTVVDRYL